MFRAAKLGKPAFRPWKRLFQGKEGVQAIDRALSRAAHCCDRCADPESEDVESAASAARQTAITDDLVGRVEAIANGSEADRGSGSPRLDASETRARALAGAGGAS